MNSLLQRLHPITLLSPIADAFAGSVDSDIISMKNFAGVLFVAYWGVGATGTTAFTVEACDDVSASNTTAVVFKHKILLSAAEPATEDTPGNLIVDTASGYTTVAGSFQTHLIEVDAAVVAKTGYEFVRLASVESADSPLLGGIMAFGFGLRYAGDGLPEAIS